MLGDVPLDLLAGDAVSVTAAILSGVGDTFAPAKIESSFVAY